MPTPGLTNRPRPRARVLIDVLGAPSESGGMRLHATEVLGRWLERWGDVDDVVVVGGRWVRDVPHIDRARHVVAWPNDDALLRTVGQQLVTPLVYLLTRRRFLLATNSVVARWIPGRATTVVAHDWRHLTRPGEFTAVQRLYRRTWLRSARRARRVVTVSDKTLAETRRLLPRANAATIENGRDHAARWEVPPDRPAGAPQGDYLVAFGHHTNKRPELVVQALARMAPADRPSVVVLGARGDLADRVRRLADGLGLSAQVVLPGFVPAEDYRWLVAHAAAVVVASSDEGFGLPLAEAAARGIPAVVTRDSGVADLFASTAVAADPTPDGIAAAIVAARSRPVGDAESGSTWAVSVERLRRDVLGLGEGPSPH